MSLFPGGIFGPDQFSYGLGYGPYSGRYAVLDSTNDTPDPMEPVKPAEPMDRPYSTPQIAFAALPGFDAAPPSSFWLFWQMRRYSTIVLAHTITTAPILAGTQTIKIINDKGNPKLAEKMQKDAEQELLPTVDDWLAGGVECLHFGHFLQEIEWVRRKGLNGKLRTVPAAFHSILPGEAIMYRDIWRRFSGFQVAGEYRDARYGFLAVEQPHIDPIFGYARNENCREEWWRLRQGEANADKTERKASGIQMGISAPIGSQFQDDKGREICSEEYAKKIVNAFAQGNAVLLPLTPFTKADIKQKPELANIPAVRVEHFDWGNIGPAIEAHLARDGVLKVAIMRGWHRPEREAMAGKAGGGTNAESETQGEIGTTDTELVAAQLMRQFSKQVVNRWAVTNYGEDAADMIAMEQSPLSDPQQEFLQRIASALVADRNTGPELQANIDQRQLLERTEIPMVSEEDAKQKIADQKAEAAANAPQVQPGQPNGVPVNGNGNGAAPKNGKVNPKLGNAAMRLVKRAG